MRAQLRVTLPPVPRSGRPKLSEKERREAQAITARLFDRIGTQRGLAQQLGISEQAVSKWANGAAGWLRLAQVCTAAGISADEILGIPPAAEVAESRENYAGLRAPGASQADIEIALQLLEEARAVLSGARQRRDQAAKTRETLETTLRHLHPEWTEEQLHAEVGQRFMAEVPRVEE